MLDASFGCRGMSSVLRMLCRKLCSWHVSPCMTMHDHGRLLLAADACRITAGAFYIKPLHTCPPDDYASLRQGLPACPSLSSAHDRADRLYPAARPASFEGSDNSVLEASFIVASGSASLRLPLDLLICLNGLRRH